VLKNGLRAPVRKTPGMREIPLISVLLPVFDAQTTLAACLRSIQRQTLENWECVVVDDGSRDGSANLVRAVGHEDPRFRLLEIARGGIVAALNAGLAQCRGECVARMDADDVMHRHRLEAQWRALAEAPGWAAVGCHVRLFPRSALGDGGRAYERWLNAIADPQRLREEAFVECPIAHPALFVRRAVLEQFGYRDRGWPEDYDLLLRLLAAGRELGVVPRRLLAWRHGPGRLSRTHPNYAIGRFTACKAAFLAEGFLAKTERYVLWGYGETGKALRRALLAHDKRPAHIVELHPGRLGETIHGAPVVPPDELPGLPRHPILVSVAGEGPRREIRDALARMGFRELDDFICTA